MEHRKGNKKGGNKGIARADKQRKRVEAEARNLLTKLENRRAARRVSNA